MQSGLVSLSPNTFFLFSRYEYPTGCSSVCWSPRCHLPPCRGCSGPLDTAQVDIEEDLEGEKETFVEGPGDDAREPDEDIDGDGKMTDSDLTAMQAIIEEASKGVADNTDAEYKR